MENPTFSKLFAIVVLATLCACHVEPPPPTPLEPACPAFTGPTIHKTDVTTNETWSAAGSPHVIEGDVDIVFDGKPYTLRTGDFAWTAVGSRHAFFPVEGRPVRWLEIQAPQPPAQFGMRWHARWERFAELVAQRNAAQ